MQFQFCANKMNKHMQDSELLFSFSKILTEILTACSLVVS